MKYNDFKVIFEVIAGSHLYGTSTDSSDMDFRGVCITSIEEMVDPFDSFEQQVETKSVDRTIFHLRKFVKLASENNPNIIELFFARDSSIKTITQRGMYLLSNVESFLSQEIRKTFSGMAMSQLQRIELHRGYLLNPPKKMPERSEYGLPEAPLFGLEKINLLIKAPQDAIKEEWIDYALREKKYRSASDNWSKYIQWKNNRNPKRYVIEEKYGYDLKHASHLVRVLLEGIDLLTKHHLIFPLEYADFLREILSGKYKYDELMSMIDEQISSFNVCPSDLPLKPDYDIIRNIYNNILFESWD